MLAFFSLPSIEERVESTGPRGNNAEHGETNDSSKDCSSANCDKKVEGALELFFSQLASQVVKEPVTLLLD